MKQLTVFISSPRGFHKIDRYKRTLALWDEAARRSNIEGAYDHVKIVRTQPTPTESHQGLLARTYATKILPAIRRSHFLITECDFIPLPSIFYNLHAILSKYRFSAPTSCSRRWSQGDIYSSPGELWSHKAGMAWNSDTLIRSTAPWLLAFNLVGTPYRIPSMFWFQNGGDPPDTGNIALLTALEEGVFGREDDYEILTVDAWTPERPCFSLRYEGFGYHGFHTRDCLRDPDFELCGLKLKVKDHFAAYDHALEEAEEAFNGKVLEGQGNPV